MKSTARLRTFLPLFLLILATLACGVSLGGGDEETPEAVVSPEQQVLPTEAPADTPLPLPTDTPSGVISTLDDLKQAVIQIEAQGSFVDPAVGLEAEFAGRGSGFIIDPSGIAVTNNHVVTGAALLRVWLGGSPDPINARVLGVSECSDLAVIDLDGEGYQYLEWYDGAITAGLEVYAAGYPLGEPEFTLTRGIVAKERAVGESAYSSVDAVIQHDAVINPGSSGGPLVTGDAKVVAVNYQGIAELDYYLAIARNEALGILEQLQGGEDVTSIGINGTAVTDGETISGIWVSSVKSGSPADQAGIEGGDILTRIEGLTLGVDGTMSDYCDILRSHSPSDVLAVEVLRFDTEEVLEGQINGNPLELAFSFADVVEEQVGDEFEGAPTTVYNDYVAVTDDTGYLYMEVPADWADVDGSSIFYDDGTFLAAAIQAAPSLDDFWSTYSTPGVAFYASEDLALSFDAASLLDEFAEEYDCDYDGRYEYDDGLYTGLYDLYVNCGGVGSAIVELAAGPEHEGFLVYLVIQAISDADFEALDQILNTFYVTEEE